MLNKELELALGAPGDDGDEAGGVKRTKKNKLSNFLTS
eukprot:CAMPEP_0185263262 /NCGR_PEP_ID=MMETSP1359-20130426/13079_1 /TAXON_ID=552665 /ORGANISM="Bigelowiella longifila, Strain CCMP242" /LENGTH=37 /DNA_ID= /DNA_START= /DNA_END= /DNA_ORIENTATION=